MLNKAQKNKETLSLFVLGVRNVIADVLRCRCFRWRSSLFTSWTSCDDGNYLFGNFSWFHTMIFIFCQDLSNIASNIVWCFICVDLMDFANHDVDHLAFVSQIHNVCFWHLVFVLVTFCKHQNLYLLLYKLSKYSNLFHSVSSSVSLINCFEVIKFYRNESSINDFSLFLYPSLFSNPLTTLSKTDNYELHTLKIMFS